MATQSIKESVRNIHKQQILHAKSNEDNMTEIVHILGGIDEILSVYLSKTYEIPIEEMQLTNIQKLLETPHECQSQNNQHVQLTAISRSSTLDDPLDIYYYLDDQDTYLSCFCKNASNISLRLLQNYFIVGIVGISAVFGFIFFLKIFGQNIYFYTLYSILMLTVLYPYAILLLLSVNRKGFRLIARTFEFMYKVLNGVTLIISGFWLYTLQNRPQDYRHWYLLMRFGNELLLIVCIVIISSLDAYKCSKKFKMIVTTIFAIFFSIFTIVRQMQYYNRRSDLKFVTVWFMSFSLEASKLSAQRILALFFCKQAVVSMLRYKSGLCISIKFNPSVKWRTLIKNTIQSNTINTNYSIVNRDIANSDIANSHAMYIRQECLASKVFHQETDSITTIRSENNETEVVN